MKINLKEFLNDPQRVDDIEAKVRAKEVLPAPSQTAQKPPVISAEPKTILMKRPCLHRECIGNSTCKQARTTDNGLDW
jgi:hypothetical protein